MGASDVPLSHFSLITLVEVLWEFVLGRCDGTSGGFLFPIEIWIGQASISTTFIGHRREDVLKILFTTFPLCFEFLVIIFLIKFG